MTRDAVHQSSRRPNKAKKNMNTLEKQVTNVIESSIHDAMKTSLTAYGSPLNAFVNEVLKEHEQELKSLMRESLGTVVTSQDFKASVREAFSHKVARTLVENLDGAVKQAADKLKQDPTIKAQMVLAIQKIVDSSGETTK